MADSGTAADDRLPDRGDAIGALGELRDMALDVTDPGSHQGVHNLYKQAMTGLALGAPYLPCQLCGHGLTDTTRDLLARGDIELLRVQKLQIDQFSAEVVLLRGQLTAATEAVAGPFALYVHDVCWGNGYETLDLALGDALEAISDRDSIDGVEVRAVAALGVQQ